MASRILGAVTNSNIISRNEALAVARELVIDNSVHVKDEVVARGTLMGKIVSSGKYRAYAQGTVKAGGAFATTSPNFTLDVSVSPIAKHLRVGDVIEDTGGNALGTILTYNPATGVGTLSANSSSNLAAGGKVRIALASLSIANEDGKLLQDEVKMPDSDYPSDGFMEGFFVYANTTVTAEAISAMGAHAVLNGTELRLK